MAFADSYDKTLRPVLNAVDEVARILGNDTRIPLPKTVVIGDQSSGKSSLLESVFGFPLPRGQDIVTRTPIQVRPTPTANYHQISSTQAFATLL